MEWAGKRVRIISDPGQKGICTSRERMQGKRKSVQVQFPDRTRWLPEYNLEIIDDLVDDPLDLFMQKQLFRVDDLRQTMAHVRLSGRLVDLIYSMEITNTDFYAYQFKPILKLLESVNRGLLIADEVGLGKTIEAGLIWTELRSRYDFRRLLVLCPAVLREKWQYELKYRFGIRAEIVNAYETFKRLKEAVDYSQSDFTMICSMQGLRSKRNERREKSELEKLLEDYENETPMIDCLIVDEAHYMRNPESKTSKLGRQLRAVSDYILLLSATPIHLASNDLFQLLNLVDADTFSRPTDFDEILKANRPLIEIREYLLKKELSKREFLDLITKAQTHPLLESSRQLAGYRDNPPGDEELKDRHFRSELADKFDTINILGNVLSRTRKRDVIEDRVIRNPHAEKIEMTIAEQEFYERVTDQVRQYCAMHNHPEGFILVTPQRQMSSCMAAALREWQQKREQLEEMMFEDLDEFSEMGPLTQELVRNSAQMGDFQDLYQTDSKYNRLKKVLEQNFQEFPTDKVILFSYFRATIKYLSERLARDGIESLILRGGEKTSKSKILEEFKNSKKHKILLSTEVGSEGIDLQFCRFLINYDLPWNPMRVEQRIGRIDRLGQKADKIMIWNILYDGTIDSRIYDRLYKRLNIFENSLGGLEPIIGAEIRKLTFDLLSNKLTPEEETARIDQSAQALAQTQLAEQKLEEEATNLIAYGDYLLNKINAARDLGRWINGDDLKNYVIQFMNANYTGCKFEQIVSDHMDFNILLNEKAKHDLEEFIKNKKLVNTPLIRNNPHPVKCRFDNKLFHQDGRFEIINQVHPIIRFINHEIERSDRPNYPAVAIKMSKRNCAAQVEQQYYAFCVQKWSVRGLQDIEKLYYCAMPLSDSVGFLSESSAEDLITKAYLHGNEWSGAQNELNWDHAVEIVKDHCLPFCEDEYENYCTEIKNKNYDRADLQLQQLENHLQNQVVQKTRIRDEHLRLGRKSLAAATDGQINAVKSRVNRARIEINNKKEPVFNKIDISVGIIKII
ncbi:helicase [candidate division KSB1 bacterium]|nr:helicase [candidate division KSB1 bacterium]